MIRIIFPADQWETLESHFAQAAQREEGAFLLFRHGRGEVGARLLVEKILLPVDGAWDDSGRDHLRPSGQWVSAALGTAIDAGTGLAFIHSHPGALHPSGLSWIDERTSAEWARTFVPMVVHFASLVWSPHGVEGVAFSEDRDAQGIGRVEVHGDGKVSFQTPGLASPDDSEIDDRQIRALSSLGNARIRNMHVALVGVGGTGSSVAEQLARMGVGALTLIDPDSLDHASNMRRIAGARLDDARNQEPKTTVVGRYLRSIGLPTNIRELPSDVRTERAARAVLDSDIAISSTDNHSSRAFLNQLAYQYDLPVIDVGVRIGTSSAGAITGMPIEIRSLLSGLPCLLCRRVINPEQVRIENLPADEREALVAEGYIQGAPRAASVTPLSWGAASFAILTMLRIYSGQALPHASVIFDGWEDYVQPLSTQVAAGCLCAHWRRLGDDWPVPFLDEAPPS